MRKSNLRCWWCTSQLALITVGPRKGQAAFRIVKDQIKNEHKVHVACYHAAKHAVREITAQPRELPPRQGDG